MANSKLLKRTLSIPCKLTLGYAKTFVIHGFPDDQFRPKFQPVKILCNTPGFGFVEVHWMMMGDISCIIGGKTDAHFYASSDDSNGIKLALPVVDIDTPIVIKGRYTGQVPEEFKSSVSYELVFLFITDWEKDEPQYTKGSRS
jgi:hypothetical protein